MKDRFTPLADYLSKADDIYSDSDDETSTENNFATYRRTQNRFLRKPPTYRFLRKPPTYRYPPLANYFSEAANIYSDSDDETMYKTRTENNSATYRTTQNPNLDFFFHVTPDTSPQTLITKLESSWAHDPLTTLKLICNLRGIRGTRHTWHWLVEGEDVREVAKRLWMEKKLSKGKGMARKMYFLNKKREEKNKKREANKELMMFKKMVKIGRGRKNNRRDMREDESRMNKTREERVEENRKQMEKNKYEAKKLRKQKDFAMKEKLNDRYGSDQNFRMLHDQVSTFFAECLRSDIDMLKSGESRKISLAAKWCPSVDSSYDKALLICELIARILYPWDSDSEFEALDEFSYIVRIKNKLRKEALVPLRNALMLPEVYMSAKEWSSITYERVASIAMKNYTDIFLHRDNERFHSYLEKVKLGDAKISAGALLPHEIISSFQRGSGGGMVAELQWKRMVDDLLKEGKLTNCIEVCDVSGSMHGTPMQVCVALGLLVSELSEEPWKGHVITFSESPELHLVEGPDLKSKTEFIENMNWDMNTNFQKVFDKMLEVAVSNKLSEDDMVKRVFVFSDMEFDQASSCPWETDYEAFRGSLRVTGIDSRATPVTANQKGVALLSGFSKNLLTLFLEGGGMINPEDVPKRSGLNPVEIMEAAISGELYQKLVVFLDRLINRTKRLLHRSKYVLSGIQILELAVLDRFSNRSKYLLLCKHNLEIPVLSPIKQLFHSNKQMLLPDIFNKQNPGSKLQI
ncbi:hypothetical protein CTI12_AA531340 [Artemisia annua]|uniref:Uncharacterized protein n=1 Tax=Artemisia annua TaxID=35608 RepID=A0A2U1L4I0_ARTAN|nr:hypothetical protein CTI12_AA531340 [Artemisia annua]